MGEKAELLDRLQEEEHRIIQLSGETETIGESEPHRLTCNMACPLRMRPMSLFLQASIYLSTRHSVRLLERSSMRKTCSSNNSSPRKQHLK